jgi:capsular exopolysaccharide synthesis family protein
MPGHAPPSTPPQPRAEKGTGLNVPVLLRAFRRHWLLSMTLGLFCAVGVAAVAWKLSPVTYTGRTLVEVSSVRPVILSDLDRVKFEDYQRTQVAMVRSRVVLRKVLKDPEVADLPFVREKQQPLEWLEKQIQADFSIAPEFMTISMTGADPDAIRVILASVRDVYLKEVIGRDHQARRTELAELRKIYGEYDELLREKRATLKRLADDLGAREVQLLVLKQELAMKELSAIQTELIAVQSRLRAARLETAFQQQKEKSGGAAPSPAALEELVGKHPSMVLIRDEIARLSKEMVVYAGRAKFPEKEEGYQRLRADHEAAKQKLVDQRAKLLPELREELREESAREMKLSGEQNKEKVEQLEKLEQMLLEMVQNYTTRATEIGKKSNNLETVKEDVAQIDEIAKQIRTKLTRLEIEQRAPERVHRLEEPIINPPSVAKFRNASLAAAAAFALVVLAFSFWEYSRGKVTTSADLATRLGVPIVGTLPILPPRILRGRCRAGNSKDLYWRNLLIESVDSTRTMVLHTAEHRGLRVIMVTSALGGEGKTMLSTHLVASLARAGRKVLLVDCDLRRPAIHRLFTLPPGPGLSEVLRGEAALSDVLRAGPIPGLTLITAGQPHALALQMVAQGGLSTLFQKLREQFDFIILDSAPVLPVTDSQLVGQCADGVILAVMLDVSRLPAVAAAYERLANLDIRTLGVVIHGAETAAHYGTAARYLTALESNGTAVPSSP